MGIFDFREKLRDGIDDAWTQFHLYKSYEEGLDKVTDIVEEVFAEELGRIITEVIMGMSNDLNKAQQMLMTELNELQVRRENREKIEAQEAQIQRQVGAELPEMKRKKKK